MISSSFIGITRSAKPEPSVACPPIRERVQRTPVPYLFARNKLVVRMRKQCPDKRYVLTFETVLTRACYLK